VSIPPHHDESCWGCGDNPLGIHLPLPACEGANEYEAYVTFDERHQGGPGFVHGGLISAALDEACGLLATWYRFPAVTVRIFVRYRRPVAINTELLLRARIDGERGRRIHVSGDLNDGDEPLAEARAAFRTSRSSTSSRRRRDARPASAGAHGSQATRRRSR
jgi:acyl-coenzyme A thioesterase PaaI-like protein